MCNFLCMIKMGSIVALRPPIPTFSDLSANPSIDSRLAVQVWPQSNLSCFSVPYFVNNDYLRRIAKIFVSLVEIFQMKLFATCIIAIAICMSKLIIWRHVIVNIKSTCDSFYCKYVIFLPMHWLSLDMLLFWSSIAHEVILCQLIQFYFKVIVYTYSNLFLCLQ